MKAAFKTKVIKLFKALIAQHAVDKTFEDSLLEVISQSFLFQTPLH